MRNTKGDFSAIIEIKKKNRVLRNLFFVFSDTKDNRN